MTAASPAMTKMTADPMNLTSQPCAMNRMHAMIRIGTAGWSIPKPHAAEFAGGGTHLQRYAQRFPAVEINSSFYRSHKPETYARWAASVPSGFRFAVKVPREITHIRKLAGIIEPLDRFLAETKSLGDQLGPLLVQLPPSLRFNNSVAGEFFHDLRARFDGQVVCEPRHSTWFTDTVDAALSEFRIVRAAADPAPVPRAASPGGWAEMVYRRLHGSPKMYYSAYSPRCLDIIARHIRNAAAANQEQWCIFDNTALGEATHDALAVLQHLDHGA
jgi:uncharacterized protein YecE (DUF72 family)